MEEDLIPPVGEFHVKFVLCKASDHQERRELVVLPCDRLNTRTIIYLFNVTKLTFNFHCKS